MTYLAVVQVVLYQTYPCSCLHACCSWDWCRSLLSPKQRRVEQPLTLRYSQSSVVRQSIIHTISNNRSLITTKATYPIDLYDVHVVAIDREEEFGEAGHVDQPQTVSLSRDEVECGIGIVVNETWIRSRCRRERVMSLIPRRREVGRIKKSCIRSAPVGLYTLRKLESRSSFCWWYQSWIIDKNQSTIIAFAMMLLYQRE